MYESGALAVETTRREPCRLSLIIVVNTAIIGLVATFVIAAVEIGSHLLP